MHSRREPNDGPPASALDWGEWPAHPPTEPIPQRPRGSFADCYTDKAEIELENRCERPKE
jgi:hypothetical protein